MNNPQKFRQKTFGGYSKSLFLFCIKRFDNVGWGYSIPISSHNYLLYLCDVK